MSGAPALSSRDWPSRIYIIHFLISGECSQLHAHIASPQQRIFNHATWLSLRFFSSRIDSWNTQLDIIASRDQFSSGSGKERDGQISARKEEQYNQRG